MAKSRRPSGRVTPKGTKPAGTRRPEPGSPPPQAAPQVGRRPSNPGFLVLVAMVWIVIGIVMFVALDASWKYVPGIVSIGIGLLFLRGAAATVVRRQDQ